MRLRVVVRRMEAFNEWQQSAQIQPRLLLSYNLQLDRLSLQLDRTDLKVHTDRADVALGVGIIGETQKQTRLAHARVANEQQLEEVVADDEGDAVVVRRNGAGKRGRETGQRQQWWYEDRPSNTYYSGFMVSTSYVVVVELQ